MPFDASSFRDDGSWQWAGVSAEDEHWSTSSPSEDGGTALREGVESLFRDPFLKFCGAPTTALNRLEALYCIERSLELERALLIAEARVRGASWSQIAERIGLTKQATHHRYHKVAEEIAAYASRGLSGEDFEDYIYARFNLLSLQTDDE